MATVKRKGQPKKWLEEVANYVSDKFNEHDHGFILIPWSDLDKSFPDSDDFAIGSCATDCDKPFMFCVALAGAIHSYAMTSGGDTATAAETLAKSVLEIVKDVERVHREKKQSSDRNK